MEEILASIRRIISDDTPAPVKSAPAPAASVPPSPPKVSDTVSEDDLDRLFAQSGEEDGDVLELTDTADAEPMGLVPETSDLEFMEPDFDEPEPAPPPPPPRPAAKAPPRPAPAPRLAAPVVEDFGDPLVSDDAGASVNAAFSQLTHTIFAANAKTLDDIVKELLRPMLKGWLDENLPVIVERLVRAEIERVSRGR